MSIVKRGTCSSSATLSSFVRVCSKCGYTEMSQDTSTKKCPKCETEMESISSQENDNNSANNV